MPVVGEGLDDVGSGVDELLMQRAHLVRMVEHDLGHEGSGLQVAAPLELEQVPLRADHGALLKPLEQTRPRIGWGGGHHVSSDVGGRWPGSVGFYPPTQVPTALASPTASQGGHHLVTIRRTLPRRDGR